MHRHLDFYLYIYLFFFLIFIILFLRYEFYNDALSLQTQIGAASYIVIVYGYQHRQVHYSVLRHEIILMEQKKDA